MKKISPVEIAKHYPDMAKLAVIFNHDIVETPHGTWRWKENSLINHLSQNAPVYVGEYTPNAPKFRAQIDLNELENDLYKKKFTVEEKMKYSMQTGYSLSGFSEIYGQHEASDFDLKGAKTKHSKGQDPKDYVETVIEYMLRVHKGKRLKL